MTTSETAARDDTGGRRVVVTRSTTGWEVSEQEDDRILRRMRFRDWHRVERALHILALEWDGQLHSTNL